MSEYTNLSNWYVYVKGTQYLSTKPIKWHVGYLGSGLFITVPPGEFFDGTIPWWACPLFSPHNPKYLKAFLLHDYLLKSGWDRLSAGAVFHEALKSDKVSKWERAVMTLTVMFFKYE